MPLPLPVQDCTGTAAANSLLRFSDGRTVEINRTCRLGGGVKSCVYAGTLRDAEASMLHENGDDVAVKCIDFTKLTFSEASMLYREREILAHLDERPHPNIARYHGCIMHGDYVMFVFDRYRMDLADAVIGADTAGAAAPFPNAARIAAQLIGVVDYLHNECDVVHGDLKLDNVMLDSDNNVRLIDFGFAERVPNGRRLERLAGSLHYVAPEIIALRRRSSHVASCVAPTWDVSFCGRAADAWALGVILYALVQQQLPFYIPARPQQTPRQAEEELAAAICTAPVPPLDYAPAASLVTALLDRNVATRLNVRCARAHPWLFGRRTLE